MKKIAHPATKGTLAVVELGTRRAKRFLLAKVTEIKSDGLAIEWSYLDAHFGVGTRKTRGFQRILVISDPFDVERAWSCHSFARSEGAGVWRNLKDAIDALRMFRLAAAVPS